MSHRSMIKAAGAIVLAFGCGTAAAQPCEEQWLESHGLAGPNGAPGATAVWDDGRGPALYVGGSFTHMGDQPVNRVARWDGHSWETLGEGFSDFVSALGVYQGQLIAGGAFTSSGTTPVSRIAAWDGSQWLPLGQGVADAPPSTTTRVNSLVAYNGDLIVGGRFQSAGGEPASSIARWDGAQWHTLGTGLALDWLSAGPSVNALLVDGGEVIVGGQFNVAGGIAAVSIARWNGKAWSAMGTMNNPVFALVRFQDQVVAGTYGLRYWSGESWVQFADDVDDCVFPFPYYPFCSDVVYALAAFRDQLIVGGNFLTAGEETVNHLAAWDGRSWSAVGGGVSECSSWGCTTLVSEVAEFNGDLYVGGTFNRVGADGADNLARWDGVAWHDCAPGTSSSVRAFVQHNDDLIAAGSFLTIEGVKAQRIARWDGSEWSALGNGLGGCLPTPPYECQPVVRALAVYQNDIIAGGSFTHSGLKSIHNIARWDGREWVDLASGVNGAVHALATYQNNLIAGGSFTLAGGVTAKRIARWDGRQWHAMGNGIGNTVYALSEDDGWLVAGGAFTGASGVAAEHVARWNGIEWSPMGELANDVYALCHHDDVLIAGTAVLSSPPYSVAQWNGKGWTELTGGDVTGFAYSTPGPHPVEPYVNAIASHRGKLFVGGHFSMAGSVDADFIAAWDDGTWSGLGLGTNHFIYALASYHDQLFVGGGFTKANGQVAGYLARWGCKESTSSLADLNHDGVVDGYDLAMLLASWSIPPGSAGCGGASPCAADLSGDGAVDAADVSILLGAWGPA